MVRFEGSDRQFFPFEFRSDLAEDALARSCSIEENAFFQVFLADAWTFFAPFGVGSYEVDVGSYEVLPFDAIFFGDAFPVFTSFDGIDRHFGFGSRDGLPGDDNRRIVARKAHGQDRDHGTDGDHHYDADDHARSGAEAHHPLHELDEDARSGHGISSLFVSAGVLKFSDLGWGRFPALFFIVWIIRRDWLGDPDGLIGIAVGGGLWVVVHRALPAWVEHCLGTVARSNIAIKQGFVKKFG